MRFYNGYETIRQFDDQKIIWLFTLVNKYLQEINGSTSGDTIIESFNSGDTCKVMQQEIVCIL